MSGKEDKNPGGVKPAGPEEKHTPGEKNARGRNRYMSRLNFAACVCCALCLLFFLLIFLFKLAHPNSLFGIFAFLGFVTLVASLVLFLISAIKEFRRAVKRRDYLSLVFMLIIVVIMIALVCLRF